MTEAPHKDIRYICTNCEFESLVGGYCPACDEGYMRKVCECDSGDFATQCCEPELEAVEAEMRKKLEAELEAEAEKENLEELKKQAAEAAEEEDGNEEEEPEEAKY